MSKFINSFVQSYLSKETHSSFYFTWSSFFIFLLIVSLFVLQPNAWAGLLDLTVDANGDAVFNGEDDGEKLTITFTTDGVGLDGQLYRYEISVNHNGKKTILIGPLENDTLTRNQIVEYVWDGTYQKINNEREKLPDGNYRISVKLTHRDNIVLSNANADLGELFELTADVTLDTKAPNISLNIDYNEFSPIVSPLPIYYGIDEEVSQAWLEIQKSPGNTNIGIPIILTTFGDGTYNWYGDDETRRTFFDGQYTLRLRVIDKGGNEVLSEKTGNITIDTEAPQFTDITINDSTTLINGKIVNVNVESISFNATDLDGTGVNLTSSDTDILIRPVGGIDLTSTLSIGNKATMILGNPLDETTENGEYDVILFVSDNVGNYTSKRLHFTFDNTLPILRNVATNNGEFTPGSSLRGTTHYVEATLEDNLELNLSNSTIRLTSPSGSNVFGQQHSPENNIIRWEFLSPLLADDGLQDGIYNIEIVVADKAGNTTSPIQISFRYDNLAPEILTVSPTRDGDPFYITGNRIYYSLPLNQFVVSYNDGGSGSGIALSGIEEISSVVFGKSNPDGSITEISGNAFEDTRNGVLTYILSNPLLNTDGSQDGTYILNVKAADTIGNIKTTSYQLIYDTQVPTLSSTVPAANATIDNLSEVVVNLTERASGIDFVQSSFLLKRDDGDNQVEVPINVSSNGTNQAKLKLLQPIALDGSDDGTYIIEVTPIDLAGNVGAVVRRHFYLVSRTQPQVRLTSPETGTVSSLGDITVEITNYIGSGINYDLSTIIVRNPDGTTIPESEVDSDPENNHLTWRTEATIPRNGTADGEYTITAIIRDYSGKILSENFPVVLDTQFPSIDSVNAITDPQQQFSISSTTDINDTFSQIKVEFDSSDVDFESTSVTLSAPDTTELVLHRMNDGASNLTLNFQNLVELGTYTLTITTSDNVGNVSDSPYIYRFKLDIDVPVVSLVLIGGKTDPIVYVNGSNPEIIATFVDTTGTGLALGDGESSIVVLSESGLTVPGLTTTNNDNQLIWQPVALPNDGSADGQYIVTVTPIDKAGRSGNVAFRSFIFDTQSPVISAAAPVALHQPISHIGSNLSQLQFTVEDVGPAMLNLDSQTIGLKNKNDEPVAGQVTNDGINQIYFTLTSALPTDGTADGEYILTIDLEDKAGNSYQSEHKILYDSQTPQLASVSLNTDVPLDLTPYQVTNLTESINQLTLNFDELSQVDFANTQITLIGPEGAAVAVTLENNGTDQIVVRFVTLSQGGLYTLSITPQDIVGNVVQGAIPYPFRLMIEVPELSSVIANSVDESYDLTTYQITDILNSIGSLTLSFADGAQVDFENTNIILIGPDGQEISVTQQEVEDSQLLVRFVPLTQSGLYALSVTPHDIIGNVAQRSIRYQFRLDIALPKVSSVLIGGRLGTNVYVNSADTNIVVTFTDTSGVSLAFGDGGSEISVISENGSLVSGITTSNGTNQLTWTPSVLPTDGSADGLYTVSITPVDKVGRSGEVVNRHFIYDTQTPRITAATPITLHQPISYVGGDLTQFVFTVEDVGPALLELDMQSISLEKESGDVVAGTITDDDTNQLFYTLSTPLPTDGSSDGSYILNVNLIDKAGNRKHIQHNIIYDSQTPQIVSVTLNTDSSINLTPYEVTELSETINKLTVSFDELTRVDFANTVVTLTSPNDATIPLTLQNNGTDALSASFVSLAQSGMYLLAVTSQDIIGNVAQGAIQYPFRLKFPTPNIESVKANGQDTSFDLSAYQTTEISNAVNSLTVSFTDTMRVDYENTQVTLRDIDGQEIPVTLEGEAGSDLIVRFVALTLSGEYTLSVRVQDTSGNVAQGAIQYPFRLKFATPNIESVKANGQDTSFDLSAYQITEISDAVNSLTVSFTDGMRVDYENTQVTLRGIDGQEIPVTLEGKEGSDLVVRFVALTQSGEYTLSVRVQDTSGNVEQGAVQYPFRLKFATPNIESVKANGQDTSFVLSAYQITEISDAVNSLTVSFTDGMLVDYENTQVTLRDIDGQEIPVTLEGEAGSDLVVRFVALTLSGEYTLSVRVQDTSGNVEQGAVQYPFRLKFATPNIESVKANGQDTSFDLSAYQITEISDAVNSLTVSFTDGIRVDYENTQVTLRGIDGQEIPVTLEGKEGSDLVVRFVALTQSGEYTLSVRVQDTSGNVEQGAVQYPFRLKFPTPNIESVKANGQDTSFDLSAYQTTEISNAVNSLTVSFTDTMRVDYENTQVTLRDIDGQEIPVTLEGEAGSDLIVRFVALTLSGEYTLSVRVQDTSGNVEQGAVQYPFRLKFATPNIESVKANGQDTSFDLSAYQITEISDAVNSLTVSFTDGMLVDYENTQVTLRDIDGQEIPVTLEGEVGSDLVVRFVALTLSGEYTLSVRVQDTSGNVEQGAVQYPFRLKFATPNIESVKANGQDTSFVLSAYQITEISDAVNSLTVSFTDGIRVDYENTQVTLRGIDGQEIPVTLEGKEGSDLVVRFVALTQSGEYTLSVRVQDTSGNVEQGAVQYPFRLKFATPNIESVKANGQDTSFDLSAYQITEISDAVNSLTVSFTDGMRVDYENTQVTLRGIDGQEIPVTLEGKEGSDLVVRFVALTQSGEYTLSVRVQDTSGSVAQGAIQYPFRLKFPLPSLATVNANTLDSSLELIPYELVEIKESINGLTLEFLEGLQVDFENTIVSLTGPDGQEILLTIEEEDGKLQVRFIPLVQSGSYILSVSLQDVSGNAIQGAIQYPFRLKFEVPGIASVKANTAESSMNLIQHQITELSESINSLTLEFTDAMQVDFDNTTVTLTGPNGENIGLTLDENDDLLLMVHFVPMTQNGIYTVSVTPQDKAGNVTTQSIQYQFKLDMTLPSVSSVVIDGKFGSTVYVRSSIPRIVATITEPIGVGLTFGDGGSTIVVRNSAGDQIDGTITSNGTDQLIWTPIPLLTDGTADGIYSVAITPVDKAGRSGTVVTRQFIFDTQAPRITSASPVTLHAPTSYIGGGLTQFVLSIEDVGPAGLIYTSQVVALLDGNEKPVPAALTHDELTNQLYLTLNKPFASNGSEDGPYTLHALLIDKAGNQLTSQFVLVYDSIVPVISSVEVNTAGNATALVQNEVADLSESVDTITIKFDEATRVDFANTTVSLLDPDDLTVPLSLGNDGVSQMTLRFVGLTKIGQYTLSVTPQDIAGNVRRSPNQYAFSLEFILPDVESVVIGETVTLGSGDIAYVNAENIVIVANLLDPADTGLSFDSLTGSDILVVTLDGFIVPGSIATNGTNVLAWRPLTLSSDGSSDGRYAVYVTPVDKQGREGSTIYREFIYDTQEPEITSAPPINLSQPVSYISASLTQLQFTLQDVGPADLTLTDQIVRLRNQSGGIIPTKLTNDANNQLYLTLDQPLPLDGSRDGEYTVEIELADKAGNVLSLNHPIVYDTQAPSVVSTVPEDGALLTEDITQFQVNLNDEGGSGIDWDVTSAILVDPNGVEISGELSSNGTTQLTLRTNQLVADGRYIIRVQAVDRAGNGSNSVFDRSFLLSRRLPAVISTSPITALQDEAYTNEEIEEIKVLLETADERHLSTVRLLNAAGQVIAGQQTRQDDGLVYTLVRPLATDGSEDGIYTIEFTPISSSGRSGEVQQRTFTYDTQTPELQTDAINLIVSEPEVNNSLVEIRVVFTDNQAGIDWENLDEEWLSFEKLSPIATVIEGQLSYETGEVETLVFRLTVPLADDGSADGEYKITVTPSDKAGNGDVNYEKVFTYDTSAPIIDPNSLIINDLPLLTDIDLDDYPSAISTSGGVVIQASVTDTGLGVNLSQSRIVISNPNGQEVTGTTQQNGIDTIVFKSDGLNIEGIYGVQITGIGNDSELLGFAPKGSITTTFLYETTSPTAIVTNDGGKNEFTDEAIPFEGTASDPEGVRRAGGAQGGDGEIPVPASGVKFVEIVGTGPDGQPIEPVLATDESNAQQLAWSVWSVDFLPTSSGEYDLDIRVTDNAGNSSEYDIGEYTMSVSFSFKGNTFGWPNPLRHSKNDVAYISFDLNTATDETVEVTLYIYDWGGDLVYSKTHTSVKVGERNDAEIKWNLDNQAGTPVARGIYVFRLEATNATGNSANAVGKLLVVD